MIYDASGGSSEIWFLNRGVVVVRPSEPYAIWANSLGDDGPRFEDGDEWVNAYLIPQLELNEESWNWIRENCSVIFEIELDGWHGDPDDWPEDRSWPVFQKWFDLEFIELAWDLVDAPLSSEPPPREDGSA